MLLLAIGDRFTNNWPLYDRYFSNITSVRFENSCVIDVVSVAPVLCQFTVFNSYSIIAISNKIIVIMSVYRNVSVVKLHIMSTRISRCHIIWKAKSVSDLCASRMSVSGKYRIQFSEMIHQNIPDSFLIN